MACYHPMLGLWNGERTESGAKKYKIIKVPEGYGKEGFQYPVETVEHVLIPCGQCIGCRLDKSRQWADRMLLELETSGEGIFVTLTYEEEALDPEKLKSYGDYYDKDGNLKSLTCEARYTYFDQDSAYATLSKEDSQNFMKRLRNKMEPKKVRFYLCGEYGPSTKRPHMHACLFGIGMRDLYKDGNRVEEFRKNERGDMFYTSTLLSEVWPFGYVLVSKITYETMAYVARYVTKKLNGEASIEYAKRNVIPEFSLMSRKPGIGRLYLDLHPDKLDMETIPIFDGKETKKIRIPKYYIRLMKYKPIVDGEQCPEANYFYNPEKYDEIMRRRIELSEDRIYQELSKTDIGFDEYIACKEKKRKETIAGYNKKKYNIDRRADI